MQMFSSQHEKNMEREYKTDNISKNIMDSYSHGKEQIYRNNETGRLQKLMLTASYQRKSAVLLNEFSEWYYQVKILARVTLASCLLNHHAIIHQYK